MEIKANVDIRTEMVRHGIKVCDLAKVVGVTRETMSRWLGNELTEDKKVWIMYFINKMKEGNKDE